MYFLKFLLKIQIKKKKSKKNYNFLSVTRFDENKNVKLLIDVFIENFKNLNATLSIVGTGKLINKYRKIIIKNKMSKKLNFLVFWIENRYQHFIKDVIVLYCQVIKKLLDFL